MDESKVMSMIAEGEHEGLDFKRELHLENRDDKGEFVKDVISIANSAPGNRGYILIGVDDDKLLVGTSDLEKERIQQIVHRYIRPPVVLRCSMVSMQVVNFPIVGVIQVEGTERPHSVMNPIGNLRQDDVFVRHGSVVTKATPEEIRRMHEESRGRKQLAQFIQSAETHFGLGNFKEAISAYSKVISTMPTAELFLRRGRVYKRLISVTQSGNVRKQQAHRALKDFSDAIELADSLELEKEARLERLRVRHELDLYYEEREHDIEWLKANIEGRELGEVLYLEYAYGDTTFGSPDEAAAALDRATELGYAEPQVYYLRAIAHDNLNNYGLALEDIEVALNGTERTDKRIELLTLQAGILIKLGKFKQAYASLLKARRFADGEPISVMGGIEDIKDEIFWRYSIAYEFKGLEEQEAGFASLFFRILVVSMKELDVSIQEREGQVQIVTASVPVQLDKRYPEIAAVIRRIIGEDFWEIYDEILRGELGLAWTSVKEY